MNLAANLSSTAAMIALLKVIAIDIVLSGDNAVVIAMATRNLPKTLRNKAIVWGTGGAVVLRILFAVVIVWLLRIPLVNLVGGMLLLWISYKVLAGEEDHQDVTAHNSFFQAVGTIIVADAVMSLDNVVAIAGAANGHISVIAIGVAVSVPVMIFGSVFIVKAMEKYSWIAYAGSAILAWTAGEMVLRDGFIEKTVHISEGWETYLVTGTLTAVILLAGFLTNKRREAKKRMRHMH